MHTMTRRGWAVAAAAALVSLTAATARADDTSGHAGHTESSTSTKGVTSTTSATPPSSTTTTTGANYDARAGAERAETSGSRINRTLLVSGGAVLAGSYLTSAIVGVANDRGADNRLLIPVIGPWADLADRQCDQRPCEHKFWDATLLVASGVLQAGGLATTIAAFFVPESETPGLLGANKPEKPSVRVVPMSMGRSGTGAGIGAIGRF